MEESFLEIAFEAELNTSECPELLEVAKDLCKENPFTRPRAITELRELIFKRAECFPIRTDDAYLLRFLRARNFVPARAHKLVSYIPQLVRYCAFREQYSYLYKGVDIWSLTKVKGAYECVLHDRPDYGRISIFRFGTWDPSAFPIEDLVRVGLLSCEFGIRQPKLQVIGGTIIVDLEGVTMRHVTHLTPTVAYQIVCLLGLAFPSRMRSCHFINYSWILNSFFFIFKRFIPRQAWDMIYFHGHDLKSLQSHIDKECLPPRFGGTCKNSTSYGIWLRKVMKYRNDEFIDDLKSLGEQYSYLYKDVDLWSLTKIKGAYEGVVHDRPDYGRISIFRFGTWDPSEFPIEDLVRAGLLVCEVGIRQPKMQVLGGTVIVDLEGVTMRHVSYLTPSVAYQIVCLLGLAFPLRVRSCHFINYSWILNTFFFIFKRFIPRQAWDMIYFHGHDLKSLQSHIDKECLPPRFGGTCKNSTSYGNWLKKVMKYRNDEFIDDMKGLGYVVKE